jgi:Mn2+/Fe2+ NRAMP family transporter
MVTELIGMIGVGQLFGVPAIVMVLLTIGFLMTLALTGSFKSVERVALLVGLFEFVFFAIAIKAHPTLKEAWHGFITFPENRKEYLYLTAANLGAVVMPWMIFYQQSAVVDKGLNVSHMKAARWDTAIGAVITQLIMISILVAVAATIGKDNPGAALNSVGEISQALTPYLGMTLGKLLFAFGIMGACLVAAIVVTCAAAWGLGEVLGYRRSLSDSPKKAPWFYVVYAAILIISGVFVSAHVVNLITLNIAVEVMNALLLPIVLGFLYLLATKALPEKYRLKNKYKWVCLIVLGGSAFIGLFAGLVGS